MPRARCRAARGQGFPGEARGERRAHAALAPILRVPLLPPFPPFGSLGVVAGGGSGLPAGGVCRLRHVRRVISLSGRAAAQVLVIIVELRRRRRLRQGSLENAGQPRARARLVAPPALRPHAVEYNGHSHVRAPRTSRTLLLTALIKGTSWAC